MKAKKLSNKIIRRLMLCATGTLMACGLIAGAGATEANAAAKIPISSASDFQKIVDNPKGSYYLTKNITLKNMEMMFPNTDDDPFSGTLDGNGHKIKYIYTSSGLSDYTWVTMFAKAEGATFKNLSFSGVNVNINAKGNSIAVAPLVMRPEKCRFENITASGNITVRGNSTKSDEAPSYQVSGLIGGTHTSVLKNCKSSLNINVKAELSSGVNVSGLSTSVDTLKNCSFSGKITAAARFCGAYNDYIASGLTGDAEKLNGCSNSGNITMTVKTGAPKAYPRTIGAYGLAGGDIETLATPVVSCKNTGNIKANAATLEYDVRAAGLIDTVHSGKKTSISKCSNTGKVSALGKGTACAAGIALEASIVDQCYNTGTVTANGNSGRAESQAGGLCGMVYRMKNCYNTGKISLKGSGCAGGLTATIDIDGNTTCNYATGKVSATGSKINAANAFILFKYSVGTEEYMKNISMVYNNYYTGSGKPYGYLSPDPSVQKRNPKAKKVSSITRGNCPKLSSKYWTYSSKHKRLILKNNKEK